jgi:hypothetical protein
MRSPFHLSATSAPSARARQPSASSADVSTGARAENAGRPAVHACSTAPPTPPLEPVPERLLEDRKRSSDLAGGIASLRDKRWIAAPFVERAPTGKLIFAAIRFSSADQPHPTPGLRDSNAAENDQIGRASRKISPELAPAPQFVTSTDRSPERTVS